MATQRTTLTASGTVRVGRADNFQVSTYVLRVRSTGGVTYTVTPRGEVHDDGVPTTASPTVYTQNRTTGLPVGTGNTTNAIAADGIYAIAADGLDILLDVQITAGTGTVVLSGRGLVG